MRADMLAVERPEVSIVLLVEAHQHCRDLAQAQRSLALTVFNPVWSNVDSQQYKQSLTASMSHYVVRVKRVRAAIRA